MPRLQRKNIRSPDQVRDFGAGRVDVLNLDETSVGRFHMDPGWRWSVHVAPIARTRSCQFRHLGFALAGTLHVVLDDGTELDVRGGDAYEIPAGHDAWVTGDDAFESIEFASARLYGATAEQSGERTLATVLFTDIVNSTSILTRIGDTAWHELLLEHNTRLRAALDRFRGREVKTTGDGFQAIFDSATRAVRCAATMVDTVADLDIRIRAGLHTGEVELAAGNLHGVAVHAAARVTALAGAGEVLVSSTTRELLDGSGLAFEDRGHHELKGLTGLRGVFALIRPSS